MTKEQLAEEGRRRRTAVEIYLQENDLTLIFCDGLDHAILGVATSPGSEAPMVVYSTTLIIQGYMIRDGMSEEDAWDYFGYNVQNAYFGEGTPAYLMPGMDDMFAEVACGANHRRH